MTFVKAWLKLIPASRLALTRSEILPHYHSEPTLWRYALKTIAFSALVLFWLAYGFGFALTAPYLILQFSIPVVVLGLLAIWALPTTKSPPIALLEALFFAFLIALALWPNYIALVPPGMPWITMIRLTGFPLAFAFLLCLSASPEFRRQLGVALNEYPAIWKLFTIFICTQFLTIPFSHNIALSINKVIVYQISWTLIFFTSCYVFLRDRRPFRFAFIYCGTAVLVALVGFWEFRLEALPWAGYIPNFLKIEDESVLRILAGQQRAAIGEHRVQSVFTTSLGLAEFLALAAPFFMHFALGSYPLVLRIVSTFALPLLLTSVIMTDSRLGMVGFILAMLLYPLFWGALRWRRDKKSIFGPALVLAYPAIFCVGVAATFVVGRLRNHVWGNGAHRASNEGRIAQYESGIPMILKQPFGHGPGTGAETLGYANQEGTITIDTYYLLIGLEYGIVGFFAYYGLILYSIYIFGKYAISDVKPDRNTALLVPITIALFIFFVIKSVFSNQDNHPLAFMMLGMGVALVHRVRSSQRASAAKRRDAQ